MRVVAGAGLGLLMLLAGTPSAAQVVDPSPAQPIILSPARKVAALKGPVPTHDWLDGYLRQYDRAATGAGLLPLRQARLREGEREMRIWTKIALSGTTTLHRFTERDGRVRGELIYTWDVDPPDPSLGERPGETYHDYMVHDLRGGCEEITVSSGTGVCRVRFRREPPWRRVLSEAEANGLWTLPDQSTLPRSGFWITIDGWGMVVELRDGEKYRAYHYRNPWSHPEWREATLARAIARSMQGIDSLRVLPDVQRVYRGLTTGKYRSAFTLCGSEERWEFAHDLPWMLEHAAAAVRARAPGSASDTTSGRQALFEVEVLGMLRPDSYTRSSGSPYARVLQPLELRAVRPASPNGCRSTRAR